MKRKPIFFIAVFSLIINLFIVGIALAAQPADTPDPQKADKPVKSLDKKGKIPAKWNLKKPVPKQHPDEPPPVEGYMNTNNLNATDLGKSGGSGGGTNNISFNEFESGDLIVVLGTTTGHTGEFDLSRYRNNLDDYCIWSANTTPENGVQLEQPIKYRNYPEAYGLWVPGVSYTKRIEAKDFCENQKGEPYTVFTSKTSTSSWYCSKLDWASYYHTSGLDLDADGGYWVWPVDLVNDNDTSVFAYSNGT